MSRKLRIAYFAHSLRSDWNNGNAHFLRGLMREMGNLGHDVRVFEPQSEWSIENLLLEPRGKQAIEQFEEAYRELKLELYDSTDIYNRSGWRQRLRDFEVVILHEWNPAPLSALLLELRDELEYRLIFHDTHHRASSSPERIRLFGIDKFNGIVVFGDVLRRVYASRFKMERVWTLHEAADTKYFYPIGRGSKRQDVVWIGNWGDEERSEEIRDFLLRPATQMPDLRVAIYGVRYPAEALHEVTAAGAHYGGYLPNLEAPCAYADAHLTVHVPRQQYAKEMAGIPTIRVFEALACGIPLISAPWCDVEGLFRPGDFSLVHDSREMCCTIKRLLDDPTKAAAQAKRGRETILRRHTCAHRAIELSAICEEVVR